MKAPWWSETVTMTVANRASVKMTSLSDAYALAAWIHVSAAKNVGPTKKPVKHYASLVSSVQAYFYWHPSSFVQSVIQTYLYRPISACIMTTVYQPLPIVTVWEILSWGRWRKRGKSPELYTNILESHSFHRNLFQLNSSFWSVSAITNSDPSNVSFVYNRAFRDASSIVTAILIVSSRELVTSKEALSDFIRFDTRNKSDPDCFFTVHRHPGSSILLMFCAVPWGT